MHKKKANSDKFLRTFKTEISFSEKDSLILDGQSKICNWIYNHLMNLSIDDYNCSGNTLKLLHGYNARDFMVNTMKSQYPFIKSVFSSVTKNTALRFTDSFTKFFKEHTGYPKYRSWKNKWFSLHYDEIENKGVSIDKKEITLSLGVDKDNKRLYVKGLMKNKISYKQNYKLKTLILSKKQNKFYASITVELEKKKTVTENKEKWIVIDPNHKNFFVALDYKGNTYQFNNATFFKFFDKDIDYLKSRLSKCKKQKVKKIYDENKNYIETKIEKASKNYVKIEKALNNLYHKRQEQIKTLCYGIAHWLCKEYDFIGIGDYTPSTDTATEKNMHRSMLNQTYIGKFRGIVNEVASKSYKNYKKLDEKYSTQRCSFCFDLEKHLPDERMITCKKCGKTIYRDANSCLNFAINEDFILSGTDFVGLDFTKPTYTFNLNHKSGSIQKLVDFRRQIKEKSW